mmetsp:Transcript_74241/g.160506  ORF Transcript_74241/g.160506 Transcript_74241/m.160506 type:complete len:342 (-) Transcript_74241:651-1676(-)
MSSMPTHSSEEKALKGSMMTISSVPGSGGASAPVRNMRKRRFSSAVRLPITDQKTLTKTGLFAISSSIVVWKTSRMLRSFFTSAGQSTCFRSGADMSTMLSCLASCQKPLRISCMASGQSVSLTLPATYPSRVTCGSTHSSSFSSLNCASLIFRVFLMELCSGPSKRLRSSIVGSSSRSRRSWKKRRGRWKEILQWLAMARHRSLPKVKYLRRRSSATLAGAPALGRMSSAYAPNHCAPEDLWNSKRGWTGACSEILQTRSRPRGVVADSSKGRSTERDPSFHSCATTRVASLPPENSTRRRWPTLAPATRASSSSQRLSSPAPAPASRRRSARPSTVSGR